MFTYTISLEMVSNVSEWNLETWDTATMFSEAGILKINRNVMEFQGKNFLKVLCPESLTECQAYLRHMRDTDGRFACRA